MSGALTDRAREYKDAAAQQAAAADPRRDVFVSANAGSGKTHVLVSRVSRLLLSGANITPDKILCLTYTKAAASEMQTRLFETLGKWSIMKAEDLRKELDKLLGPEESAEVDLRLARRLFANALETAPDSETAWALSHLMGTMANATLDGLRGWMGYNIYKIRAWEEAGGTAPLAEMLGIDAQTSADSVKRMAWAAVPKDKLKAAISAL